MTDVIKITLENEMDLILAQQRSMKLADFTGLSLSAQTSFGTAVSEVCRYVLDKNNPVTLTLGVEDTKEAYMLAAKITNSKKNVSRQDEALLFAARLTDRVAVTAVRSMYTVELYEKLSPRYKFTIDQIDEWRRYFRNQAPLSPYEEVKQKNIQLRELTQKLAESEQQYKTLAESLPLAIYTTNSQGELQYINSWLAQFAGQGLEEVKNSNWASLIHNEDVGRLQAANETTGDYRIKNKNGEYVWHTGKTVPVNNNVSEPYNIGYFADIDAQKLVEQTLKDNRELKAAQQELARYQAELEQRITELNQTNLELAQFAYVSSHDLQEPLRKLMIYNDTLQHKYSENITPEVQFIMGRMTECCRRMRQLISDLLTFSKIRKDELVFAPTDLNEVFNHVLDNLELAIHEKGALVTVEKLPRMEVSTHHIKQLFENLLGNALKYSKPGVNPKITVSVINTQNGMATIAITDNGIGFENQFSDRIFGLFQRLHNKNEFDGTGIGLALCKKIAELHNGTITASGEPGVGAKFTITLPLTQAK